MAQITFEVVAAAVAAIEAAGQKPSVRKVMEQLLVMTGVKGSPNTVTKFLNDYKAGRPVVRVADVGLDSGITQAIVTQMQRVAEQATVAAEERAADLEDNLQLLMESQTESEQSIEKLTADLSTEQQTNASLHLQLKDMSDAADRSKEQFEKDMAKVVQELSIERGRADKSAADLARAEVRLEAVPSLQSEIERLRSSLEASEKSRQDAMTAAAVANAQIAGMNESKAVLEAAKAELVSRVGQLSLAIEAEQKAHLVAVSKLAESDKKNAVLEEKLISLEEKLTSAGLQISKLTADLAAIAAVKKDEKAV